jgi:hypothetical protein
MATLQQAIDEIQTAILSLAGIRDAPSQPPEAMNAFPFVVCYPRTGIWEAQTPETKIGLHNLVVELHVARKDLPRDVEKALAYSESIPNVILLRFKDGTFTAIQMFDAITYEFLTMGWAGIDTIGFRFTITNVKMVSVIT